ncbi:MAG: hypothetical protein K0R67_3645 [Paenibacillus sp.]|jgi:putative aldouronate transport system substrate-binding protein|nr:hypothetical protein [Paenibacillus sp.]
MKRWKKGVPLMLASVLVLGTVTACSSGGSNGGATASPTATGSASAKPQENEKPIEITWLGFNPPDTDNSPVQQYLEKKYNIKLKNMRIDRATWREQLNVKLAGKEIPDLFFLWGDEIESYASQGLLAELTVADIKKALPNYSKSVDQLDPKLWNFALFNGKNYAIPLYSPDGNMPFLPAYNSSWLKKIGYNEPPKTLKEYEEVLYKFTNEDPDGNGKNDTYGLSARGKDSITQSFNSVFGAYGMSPFYWQKDKDGKLVYGMTTESAREVFRLLNKWHKDKVIDPEFITGDYTKIRQDLANGRSGVFDSGRWDSYFVAINPEFKAKNPNSELVIGKPLDGPNGKGANMAPGVKNNFIGMGVQVEKDAKKKAKLMQILNDLASDPETYLMATYGEAGVHYDMKDGAAVPKTDYVDPQVRGAKTGAGNYYSLFNPKTTEMLKYDYPADRLAARDKSNAGVNSFTNALTFVIPEAKDFPDLGKLQNEYFIKFILGEVNLDKGFDDFVALWKKSGGQTLTDSANKIYATMK